MKAFIYKGITLTLTLSTLQIYAAHHNATCHPSEALAVCPALPVPALLSLQHAPLNGSLSMCAPPEKPYPVVPQSHYSYNLPLLSIFPGIAAFSESRQEITRTAQENNRERKKLALQTRHAKKQLALHKKIFHIEKTKQNHINQPNKSRNY